jgi:hypothetical protein
MTSSTLRLAADLQHDAFHSEDEIDLLRERSPAGDPAEQNPREWDRWSEECADLSDEAGVIEALEAVEKLVPRQRTLAKQIVEMATTTLAGSQVLAVIIAEIFGR